MVYGGVFIRISDEEEQYRDDDEDQLLPGFGGWSFIIHVHACLSCVAYRL